MFLRLLLQQIFHILQVSFLVLLLSVNVIADVAQYGALNVSSLTIDGGAGTDSSIIVGNGAAAFTLGSSGTSGSFGIGYGGSNLVNINSDGSVDVMGKIKSNGVLSITGSLVFRGVSQWLLVAFDDFTNGGEQSWSNKTVSICGNENKKILGGYGKFAGGEVSKTFSSLPPHQQIRLKANYHFIDSWGGETAYAKMANNVVWTDTYDQQTSKVGIQICGSPAPESKFTVPIDVILPHNCKPNYACSLRVAFGSTLTLSSNEQSWGISDVQIFIR